MDFSALMRAGFGLRLLCIAAAMAAPGCGGEKFKTAGVTGTVTVEGQPVAGVMLEFEPERVDGTILPAAYGSTDAEGRYSLERVGGSRGGAGGVVGKNTVRISAPEGSQTQVAPFYAEEGAFTREIVEGSNVFDFDLKRRPTASR